MTVFTKYEHGQFCWIDLNSKDMQQAKDFYARVFGWECVDQETGGPPYAIFKQNGQQVAGLGQMSTDMIEQGIPSLWNSYVNVDDCEAAAKKAEELGGKIVFPTMQVIEAGWMAYLQDPAGAMFAIWQANQHHGADVANEPGSLCWNELATRDFEGSLEFYGKLLNWKYTDNENSPSRYKIIRNFERDNGGIMEMSEEWGSDIPPHWTVYFAVENAADAADNVSRSGGQVCHGPFDIPIGSIAICSDPHGGMFNLFEINDSAEIPE